MTTKELPTIVVVCGLVRDRIELVRLQCKYHIVYDATFDWMEHTFIKETEEAHDIEADIAAFVARYKQQSEDVHAPSRIHAVFSSCDHGVAIAAIVAFQLGLPCANPKQLMLTHHKYYQRQQLSIGVPEAVPKFRIMDPCEGTTLLHSLPLPFFMKPVKSVLSSHAYKITSKESLDAALCDPLPPVSFLKAFSKLVKIAAGEVEYDCCKVLCEELISGQQFTVDGFVYGSDVTVLGIVDSVMFPGTMSFASFEYPSKLPAAVQAKATEMSIAAVKALGLTNTTFNIEYFYNPSSSSSSSPELQMDSCPLKIIEVNPRFSGQFGDIYEKVDGTNSYDTAVQIACQALPPFSPRKGKHQVAASFVMRVFRDYEVQSVPSEQDIANVERTFPDAKVFVLVSPGKRLSDYIQDSGSFRYCLVHLGASNFTALYAAYERCKGLLPFQLV